MSEITFEQIKKIYIDLKELLELKKKALINKDIETLTSSDEKLICMYSEIQAVYEQKDKISLTNAQKQELVELSEIIGKLEKNNEVLITYSLNVIDKIFEGILNITSSKNADYNYLGKKNQGTSLDISSITEEA